MYSPPYDSLHTVLDSVSESLFAGREIPLTERTAIAKWLASRQGLPGSYAGTFAPTEKDIRGIHLFTGEAISSRAGIRHQLGEESCRVLSALDVKDQEIKAAQARAIAGLTARIEESEGADYEVGFYCCGTCSVSYWRNLANNLIPRAEERLHRGLTHLRQHRSGDGEWKRFPFYYTSLALTEIGPDLASAELQYAAKRWNKILPRLARARKPFSQRRAAVGQRLLEIS